MFAWLFLAFLLLLTATWARAIASSLHLLMMLSHHLLLLMMLSIHLLLTMHHLLIRPMLPVSSVCVFGSFVHLGLVSLSGVIVAVKIFLFVFVPMFFPGHSRSLAVMFSHVPDPVFSFSRASFASRANALSAFAVLRAFALVE